MGQEAICCCGKGGIRLSSRVSTGAITYLVSISLEKLTYRSTYMHKSKIKNDKILRWRMELSCYDFDIVYRPGRDNIAADIFFRSVCGVTCHDHWSLFALYDALCHPEPHFCRPRLRRLSSVNPSQSQVNPAWRVFDVHFRLGGYEDSSKPRRLGFEDCSRGVLGDGFQLANRIPLKNTDKKEIWRPRESK